MGVLPLMSRCLAEKRLALLIAGWDKQQLLIYTIWRFVYRKPHTQKALKAFFGSI